jgi:hypothetical protein
MLHDFDYEKFPTEPDHPLEGMKILRQRGWPVVHVRHREEDPASGFHPAAAGYPPMRCVEAEGSEPIEATLRSPQVQASFDQWAAQAELEPAEAKAAIERVRQGIVALYPALSVVSAITIVALNAIALGRLVQRSPASPFPRSELLSLRWPLALVVAFVGSGALLLVPTAQQVGWNGLVVTLFLFLLQGLSVLAFALTRLFSSELMRALFVVTSLLGPWAILLSLLGLFDQWFDFRTRFVNPETPAAP